MSHMLNGREKIGHADIDWSRNALGRGKFRRKTIGFGDYIKKKRIYTDFHVNIREQSIVDAGIGCAVWDAAIVMSRWIHNNQHIFQEKEVLELGSGVGLCGIVCGRYAGHVTMTDYLDPLVENLKYNISINSNEEEDDYSSSDDDDDRISEIIANCRVTDAQYKRHIKESCSVAYLNWDEVTETEPGTTEYIPQADIIIGSELTYSPKSVEALVRTIERYLKPDGVMYEILSTDRDGVEYFEETIKKAGFEVHKYPVPDKYLGNYGTKQRTESYHFCTFYRPGSEVELMK